MAKFLMKTFHEMIYGYVFLLKLTFQNSISKFVSQNSINELIFQNPIYYLILRNQKY